MNAVTVPVSRVQVRGARADGEGSVQVPLDPEDGTRAATTATVFRVTHI